MGSVRVRSDTGRTSASPTRRPDSIRRSRLVRLGLADVLLDPAWWTAVYAAALTYRVWDSSQSTLWTAIWIAAWLAALAWRPYGLIPVAALTFGLGATLVSSNGFVLVGILAAIMIVFRGEQRRLLVRVQATVVYGFTAAHKLVGPFITGAVLADVSPWLPHPHLVAPVIVFTEFLLGYGVWCKKRWALPLAILFHAPVPFAITNAVVGTWGSLMVFNAALVVMVWFTTNRQAQTES